MGKTIKTGHFFFFQGSEKVARQGVRRNQELLSKYFNSKLVPFLSKRHLTFGAFIQNTKINFMLYYTFQSQRLEGQRTDPTYQSLTLVWFCLLWRAFSGVYNSFDKYFRKQLFENIFICQIQSPGVVYHCTKIQAESLLNSLYCLLKICAICLLTQYRCLRI